MKIVEAGLSEAEVVRVAAGRMGAAEALEEEGTGAEAAAGEVIAAEEDGRFKNLFSAGSELVQSLQRAV